MDDHVQREQVIAADLPRVWTALTDEGRLSGWLADEVIIDLVPGGGLSCVVDGEPRSGWVEEVSPPKAGVARLVFWWERSGETASRVEIELGERDGGTCVRVSETRPLAVLDAIGAICIPRGSQAGPTLVAA